MEGKVLLYDANDVKIGETFMRRAKQLVKQQRATWVDDGLEAIKFAPGMEDASDVPDTTPEAEATTDPTKHEEKWLIKMAEKRLWHRKAFMLHSITFLPGMAFILLMAAALGDAIFRSDLVIGMFLGFPWGVWVTAYAIHVYYYYKGGYSKRNLSKDERWAQKLAEEVAMLKTELGK